jgi:PAS domain-containing protein
MAIVAHPHEVLLQQVREEFAAILTQSSQGIYIYLDDSHWICNDRLATLLGYTSAEELRKGSSRSSFLEAVIVTDSHQAVVDAYRKVVDAKAASSITVIWKKKGGGTLKTQTIFAPLSFRGTVLALHFITPSE